LVPVSLSPEQQWARKWTDAAAALADVRARELQSMSDDDALRITEGLLAMSDPAHLALARRTWSGLVEMQRLLHSPRHS
jgi:hypothetical protein